MRLRLKRSTNPSNPSRRARLHPTKAVRLARAATAAGAKEAGRNAMAARIAVAESAVAVIVGDGAAVGTIDRRFATNSDLQRGPKSVVRPKPTIILPSSKRLK